MDQSRALNALAPFVALAKSATAPRAAADLVAQATSAPNTYVFAELLQQPNIQSLAGNPEHGYAYEMLKIFAWGTWAEYRALSGLPQLSDAQGRKLRLLSLLTIASQKHSSTSQPNLSYNSLCKLLDLALPADLELLVTDAIYNDLLVGTLNPANQTVVITSVAPLRDLAPGSIQSMMHELAAWSGRCDSVLADLQAEIAKVRAEAGMRRTLEKKTERQVRAVTEAGEKNTSGGPMPGPGGHNTRGLHRQSVDEHDDDAMEIDASGTGLGGGGGRKRGSSGGIVSNPGRPSGRGPGR